MGQSVEQRPGQALGTERLGPLVEGKIRGDERDVVGYSFVTGDLHPLPFASSPGTPVPGVPNSGILTLRALIQSSRFDQAWAMLSETYRQEVIVPDNVVAFPCKRAA